ncbi:ribonuclease H family protein [Serpentinicella sp. ANB-PHB4]|uniref:ribonuclease H family protein n=1 Tax=Serpentinicella sp. ANB-PHB4 TaxID=3074076 RepID=UPI00285B619D|nr:ribonuclease H family protein [Serpentinicella sp. ANB-PHB4]MDR5659623.1 ribonuclease H family protein [Serpentinicella sp. ANB-PHB4]
MPKKKYYSVRKGNKVGIFETWPECQASVKGYSGAEYKSFTTLEEAKAYMENVTQKVAEINVDQINEDEMIAYVDGSYENSIGYYSYGGVTFFKGEKTTFSGRGNDKGLLDMRNVAGELLGAKAAMDYALQVNAKRLYLHYDYEGIEKWATKSWKANKDGTKEYQAYYDEISKDLEVKFIKVKAHSGDKYNEEVDQLAKDALLGK